MGKLIAAIATVTTVGLVYTYNHTPTPAQVCSHLGTVFADYNHGQCMDQIESLRSGADEAGPKGQAAYDRAIRCLMQARLESQAWACLR